MELQEQTDSDRVLESLMAAGVPEQLAVGIVDILLKAGCMQGVAASNSTTEKHGADIVSLASRQKNAPAFLRFPAIPDTLPALLLTYDDRIDVVRDRRCRDMYSYARLASAHIAGSALTLAGKKRVY